MRVAVVCPYDLGRPGGVQHQAISLVGWLRDADHDAWLVGPGEGGPPGTRSVGTPFMVPVSGTRGPLGVGRGPPEAQQVAVRGRQGHAQGGEPRVHVVVYLGGQVAP